MTNEVVIKAAPVNANVCRTASSDDNIRTGAN
ncbi:MAG: hypothetical protein ACI8W7_001256, partial [Gammaproteobacteria bacterium]